MGTNLDDNCLKTLSAILPSTKLLTLGLNSNPNLTIEGIRELADVLPHTNIVRLVLTKVSMVDISLKVLCNAIVRTRLQVLEMNYNDNISIDGVRTLLNTLPHTYLIDVRLTNCFGLQ